MANLSSYLPTCYDGSRYSKAMCAAGDAEFARLKARTQQVNDNSVVDNADEDGLKAFERDFCLKPTSDTTEVRKGRIKAKMRGSQPTTEPNMVNALKIFDQTADIEQHTENYSFIVKIQSPDALVAAMQLTDEIKPAHLRADYTVKPNTTESTLSFGIITSIHGHIPMPARRYRTYSDIAGMTYEELQGKTYEQILYKE